MRLPPSPASSFSSSSSSATALLTPPALPSLSLSLSRSPSSLLDVKIPTNRISLDLQVPFTFDTQARSSLHLGEAFPSASPLPAGIDTSLRPAHSAPSQTEEQSTIASTSTVSSASVHGDTNDSRSSRSSVSSKGNDEQWIDLPWVFPSTLTLLSEKIERNQPLSFEGEGHGRAVVPPGTPSLSLSAFLDENGHRASVFLPAPVGNSRRPSRGTEESVMDTAFLAIPIGVQTPSPSVIDEQHCTTNDNLDLLIPVDRAILTRQTRSPSLHLPWASQVSLINPTPTSTSQHDNHANSRDIIHELATAIVASYPSASATTTQGMEMYPSPSSPALATRAPSRSRSGDKGLRRLASNFSLRTFTTYKKDDHNQDHNHDTSLCDTPDPIAVATLTKSLSRSLTFKSLKNRFKSPHRRPPLPSIDRSDSSSSKQMTPTGIPIPTFIPLAPPSLKQTAATWTAKGIQSKLRLRRVESSTTIKSDVMGSTSTRTICQATSTIIASETQTHPQAQTRSPSVIGRRSFTLLRRKPDTNIATPLRMNDAEEGIRASTSSFSIRELIDLGPTPPRSTSIGNGRTIQRSGSNPLFKTLFGPRPPTKVSALSSSCRDSDHPDKAFFDATTTQSISTNLSIGAREVPPTRSSSTRPPTVLVELNTSPAFQHGIFHPHPIPTEEYLPSSEPMIIKPDPYESRSNDSLITPSSLPISRKSSSKFDLRPSTIALSLGPLPPLPGPITPKARSTKTVCDQSPLLFEDDEEIGGDIISSRPSEESFDRELEQLLESFAYNGTRTPDPDTSTAFNVDPKQPPRSWLSDSTPGSSSSFQLENDDDQVCWNTSTSTSDRSSGGMTPVQDSSFLHHHQHQHKHDMTDSHSTIDRDRPHSYAFDLPHSRASSGTILTNS